MTDGTEGATAERPTAAPLTRTASAYLGELDAAADLAMIRREQAVLAERVHWTVIPAGVSRGVDGPGAPLNSPIMQVDGYQYARLQDGLACAIQDVGRVAWWYATAALAALDAVLAGQEITGMRLERLTLLRPGRDEEVDAQAPAWGRCFRPHLPGDGELRTGDDRLDAAMDAALAPLRSAYSAAADLELADVDQDADDCEPPDVELAWLDRAEKAAMRIPDLLIAYARTVFNAAQVTGRRIST